MTTGLIPEMMLNIVNLYAPAGTALPFQQNFAPLGWVASTANSDTAMRVMTPGTFVGAVGVNGFSGLVRGSAVTDGHALTIAELAVHNHTDTGHSHTDAGHSHRPGDLHNFYTDGTSATITGPGALNLSTSSGTNVGNANILPGNAAIANTGSGTAHTHGMTNFNFLTLDFIVGVKS